MSRVKLQETVTCGRYLTLEKAEESKVEELDEVMPQSLAGCGAQAHL